ncbi:hypothetical protein DFH06DRAFT_1151811 [Mycena polygramma]|nr:hypothetical protein DFH06DRAFT_1151811 [Mycena polygramma]
MKSLRLSILEATLISAPDALLLRAMSFWTLADIITCDTLSVTFHNIVRYYKSLVWDPDIFFRSWFMDSPQNFRQMLAHCGGTVSGSQITQFFDRTRYRDSDLDIFIRIGGLQPMGRWLKLQGYRYASASSEYEAFEHNTARLSTRMIIERNSDEPIKGVFNYTRYIAAPTVIYLQKIQLIVVDTNPIDHILFDFHSTAVINYMISDAVVSVFPVPTLISHRSYVVKHRIESTARTLQWRTKYQDRGFKIIRKRTRGTYKDLVLGPRSTSDRYSWTIKLTEPPPYGKTIYGQMNSNVRFDVLAWRSGIIHKESFGRIAEPGIWRMRGKARKKYPGLVDLAATQWYRRRYT